MFKALGRVVSIGKALVRVLSVLRSVGLTDDIVTHAEGSSAKRSVEFNDNATRREWAIAAPIAAKVADYLSPPHSEGRFLFNMAC